MGLSSIIKLVIIFGILIGIGIGVLFIISQNKEISLSDSVLIPQPSNLPTQLKAEIVKTSSSEPDEITEEYHLQMKVSFWTGRGEKVITPTGELNIKVFSPVDPVPKRSEWYGVDGSKTQNPAEKIMQLVITKQLTIGQVSLTNGEAFIHLKSGFKVAEIKQYLSLSVEYKDTSPSPRSSFGGAGTTQKPLILRYDIPLYQY